MFKIEAFVEDKHVGAALRGLAGLARGMPVCHPVVNAQEDPKTKKLHAQSGGSLLQMFERFLLENRVEQLKPDDVRAFIKAAGKNPSSVAYLVKLAVEARLIKRTGKSSGVAYHVVKRLTNG